MQQILRLVDHYVPIINLLAIAGMISFFVLPKKEKKAKINILLVGSLIFVAFYENLALVLATNKIPNSWVYLIFFNHGATWLNLFILREFILNPNLKKVISGLMWGFLLFSGIPYLVGVIPFNSRGEYSSLLGASFIIFSCGMFFYELLSNDKYLPINPLQFSGFWISTVMLFFYSGSFMIFISFTYLINNYLDIYYIVIELIRTSALLLYFTFVLSLAKWKRFRPFYLNDLR